MGYFLGIDGGGSKTAVWCADERGQILGKGVAGPTNLTTTDTQLACQNLATALDQALNGISSPRFTSVVMGLAGADTQTEINQARQQFEPVFIAHGIHDLKLVNDAIIALKSGSDAANSLVAIAGTGSNCFGRNSRGETAKASGLDYWLSDEGSGYMIGLQALRAVVRANDGRGDTTALTQLVLNHFKITSVPSLKEVVYAGIFSKREMAALTMVVVQAVEQGDPIAFQILIQAVNEIQIMMRAVIHKLDFGDSTFDVVAVGSVMTLSFVKERLSVWFAGQYPQARLIYPEQPPVYGAVQLAYQAAFLAETARV